MAKASDNVFPSVLFAEGSAPTSPASGDQRVFIDSADHMLKRKNSSGTVTTIEGGGGGGGGSELGYVQVTTAQTGIGTTATDVTSLTLTVTVGTRAIMVDFYCPLADTSASDRWHFLLVDVTGSATVGTGFSAVVSGTGSAGIAKVRVAPSAGSRQYKVQALNDNASAGARLFASSTAPMWFRIYEV